MTGIYIHPSSPFIFLLTRPLRDVTDNVIIFGNRVGISTHTPLAGRDPAYILSAMGIDPFLLTRPLRDVTILL